MKTIACNPHRRGQQVRNLEELALDLCTSMRRLQGLMSAGERMGMPAPKPSLPSNCTVANRAYYPRRDFLQWHEQIVEALRQRKGLFPARRRPT